MVGSMYSLVSNSLSLGTISSGLVVGQTAYMAESGKSQIQFADFISSVPGTVFHSTEVSRIETCTLVKEEPSDPSDVNETAVETAADEKFCGEETSISPGRIK
ncbi:unnamed protein product, partial [Durusdinium trenchii]